MKFNSTPIPGLVVVESAVFRDERGGFQRIQCSHEFAQAGLPEVFVQTNLSTNLHANTLRGMHYQKAPYQEDKLVRCIQGAVLDVVIDLRPGSATFARHFAIELSAENALALLVPKGFAHGYLTLTANAAVLYHVSTPYTPGVEGGVRWNDPRFGIDWPTTNPVLSAKDAAWPDYVDSTP